LDSGAGEEKFSRQAAKPSSRRENHVLGFYSKFRSASIRGEKNNFTQLPNDKLKN
jgi:hypothetical protein